ncbi:MAG: alpha/beta fold hydrolase [Fuerstiella sp.]
MKIVNQAGAGSMKFHCLVLATIVVVASLPAAQGKVMSDEKIEPVENDVVDQVSGGIKTLGGRQFWGDVRFFRGWRIQHNVLTDKYRLLDVKDNRHCSGSLEECNDTLGRIIQTQKLPPMSGKAVVLIHGIGRSSKSFSTMAKQLETDGYTVVGFDYPSTRVPIPECAEYLHKVMQSLDGIESIDVVGHSMGGLVLRGLTMDQAEPRLNRVVMLGVPNKGAEMADFLKSNPLFKMILGPAGQQLATDGEGLIGKMPPPACEFGILAGGRSATKGYNPLLPGDNDATVTVASTRLPGAADFILLPVIHSFLMTDQAAINATRHFLKHGRFEENRKAEPISADDITVIN